MILVVWSSGKAKELAAEIERAFEQTVVIVSNLDSAYEAMKAAPFLAVVIDQWTYEAMPGTNGPLFRTLGSAVLVIVNFAISTPGRVVSTMRSALARNEREVRLARENASAMLKAEVKDELTAVLLSCGLALREPTLSLPLALRVRRIEDAANQIRRKLAGEEQQSSMHA